MQKQKANGPKQPDEDDEDDEENEELDEDAEEEENEEEDEMEEEDEEDAPPPTSSAPSTSALSVQKKRQRVKVPLLEDLVASVQAMVKKWVLAYRKYWDNVFPSFEDREYTPEGIYNLYIASQSYSTSTAPALTSQQREALKLHHQLLCNLLLNAVGDGMVHIAADPLVKSALIDHATVAVREGFRKLEQELVKGRQWSANPNKYLGRSPDEWVSSVKGIL